MIRIAICCTRGFSSGFLARHLQKCAEDEGLQNEVSFEFIPFDDLYARQDEVDIAMLMPHVEYKAKSDERPYSIPLYVIPYRVMVAPGVRDYMEDAEDILAKPGSVTGLVSFEEETHLTEVMRLVSHRKWLAEAHRA